jgi:hypothetical protein
VFDFTGAGKKNRTLDLLITNNLPAKHAQKSGSGVHKSDKDYDRKRLKEILELRFDEWDEEANIAG